MILKENNPFKRWENTLIIKKILIKILFEKSLINNLNKNKKNIYLKLLQKKTLKNN